MLPKGLFEIEIGIEGDYYRHLRFPFPIAIPIPIPMKTA